MELPDSYFEDEVREGFYIPSLMKRAWAAQMEVLEAVQKICGKHNIRYFAEWGTLLGVIRHGGRIPWDDDIDICMPREDFDRFRAVADRELPEGCWFMDWRWNDDFDHFIGRIINSRVLVVEGKALEKYHGFPYVAGLDIYALDSLPETHEEEEEYLYQFQYIYSLIHKIRLDKSGAVPADRKELEYHIRKVEEFCQVSFDRNRPIKQQLYELLEKNVSPRYCDSGTEWITSLISWKNTTDYRMPKRCFADCVAMPFETMEIMVPAGYDELLGMKYGAAWAKAVRAGGTHEYPSYREQQEFLKQQDAGQLFEYRFSKEELEETENARMENRRNRSRETMKEKVEGFLPLFNEAHEEIRRLAGEGAAGQALDVLAGCQDTAIQLGTMIEEEKGEGHATVKVLEQYCETIFQIHGMLAQNKTSNADKSVFRELTEFEKRLADSAKQHLQEKKEVVFIPYKTSFWGAMKRVWQNAVRDGGTEAYVIPAPYYYKDAYGRAKSGEPHYETDYPDEVAITSYEEYNFETRHPDMIVIQCPYDEYNYGLTIHPFFYAKNLKQYTENLVYIPPFVMDEVGPGDGRARETLKSLCNLPGVVYADTVIVQSEQMKQVYVELLTEFAGEDTRRMWEDKIWGTGSSLYD